MDKNGLIGNNFVNEKKDEIYEIPWHFRQDFKFFKKVTSLKPIIMGRKTFQSLPFILPKRDQIILSKTDQQNADNLVKAKRKTKEYDPEYQTLFFNDKYDALEMAKKLAIEKNQTEIFVIGGMNIYNLYKDEIDCFYITVIDNEYKGNVFFPVAEFFNGKNDILNIDMNIKMQEILGDWNIEIIEILHEENIKLIFKKIEKRKV